MAKIDRPCIVAGNDTTLYIQLKEFQNGEYVDFDLNQVTDLKVELMCAKDNYIYEIPFHIDEQCSNLIICDLKYTQYHTNTSYGIRVTGKNSDDKHFTWCMMPREGFIVVSNTSGLHLTDETQQLSFNGLVGWGISKCVNADWDENDPTEVAYIKNKPDIDGMIDSALENYYDKTETDALLEEKADTSDLDDYYNKGEVDGMLNNKVDTSTLVNDYYNKNTVDNLLDAKADTSDLNNYYDKTQTDTLLNQKANVSDLNNKQDTLVSSQNIKTINNQSLLGSGNIDIQSGGTQANWAETDTSDPSYIQNKPDLSIYAQSSNLSTVATSGNYNDLYNKPTIPAAQIQSDWNQTDSSAVDYIKNKPDIPESQHDYSTDYFTIVSLADNNVIGWKASNANLLKTISVSTDDGTTWTSYTSDTIGVTLATLNTGYKLLVKGSNTVYGTAYFNYFTSTDNFNVEGNIMSLIYGDNFVNQTTLDSAGYNLIKLFYNCSKLVSAENLILPATTLATECYVEMFRGCISLTNAPALPATTLADFCYNGMFYGCTALTTAPELPSTTLSMGCYHSMFYNCISLTTAPVLPATILLIFSYYGMFQYCTSLNYVKCLATNISALNCTAYWLTNVAATGTFIKDDSMNSWSRGPSGIPTGWNVYNASQDVPAMKYDIPTAPVQSNWNESDSSSLAYIQNKPTIPAAPVQSNWNEADSSSLAYIQNKPDLSNYATTSDLSNKQDTLVSGTNIKTINSQSLLGSGDITINGGDTGYDIDTIWMLGQEYENGSQYCRLYITDIVVKQNNDIIWNLRNHFSDYQTVAQVFTYIKNTYGIGVTYLYGSYTLGQAPSFTRNASDRWYYISLPSTSAISGKTINYGDTLIFEYFYNGNSNNRFKQTVMTLLSANTVNSNTKGMRIEVVAALPASPDSNTIYIIA